MIDWRVTRIRNPSLNDAVDTYDGSLTLSVTNGNRVRDLRVRFRKRGNGGIQQANEGESSQPIWRWENPPELDEITLAESVGWDLTDETNGWDVHGWVRDGEWVSDS